MGPGGDERDRTADPLLAKQVLSQLSYTPTELVIFSNTTPSLTCGQHSTIFTLVCQHIFSDFQYTLKHIFHTHPNNLPLPLSLVNIFSLVL